MKFFHSGSNTPQGQAPQGSDRKVKLLLALLLVLGGTLVFLATPFSERTLGIKLSSLFSSADDIFTKEDTTKEDGGGTDIIIGGGDGGGVVVDCVREPCDVGGGGGSFECIAAPCQNPNLSILNPTPKMKWTVGSSYKISWDGVKGEKVTIKLVPYTCQPNELCGQAITIVEGTKNTETFEWQVPPNISASFLDGMSRLIVLIDDTFYNQTDVEIVRSGTGTGTTSDGTYVRFNRNQILVYRIEDGKKRPMPFPYEEVMRCLGADPSTVKAGTQLQQGMVDGAPLFCNPFTNSVSRNGSLLSGFPDSDRTGIFLVENGKRRPFPSGEVFECLGYKYSDIHIAGSKDVANPGLPLGAPMTCGDISAPLTISGDGTLPNGRVNVLYNVVLSATGGVEPYTWEIVSVEPNATVTIDSKGQLKTTISTPGTYRITVRLCDNSNDFAPNCVTKVFTLVIESGSGGGGSGGGSGGGGSGGGSTAKNCVSNDPQYLVPLYRFYSSRDSDHYYTTSAQAPAGFAGEGITAYIYNRQVSGTVPMYQSYSSQNKDHYYTTDLNSTQSYGYRLDGIVGYIYPEQVTGSNAMYRMYNASGKHYVMTTSTVERDAIVNLGFAQQGNVGYSCGVPRPGSEIIPIYRLWNSRITDHFYTIDVGERDTALQNGYVAEGISGHIYSVPGQDRIPVYRLWSARYTNHLYTTSESEANNSGYINEGILGFVDSTPRSNVIQWYRLYNSRISDHFYTTSTDERDAAVRGGYKFEGTMGYLP